MPIHGQAAITIAEYIRELGVFAPDSRKLYEEVRGG